MFGVSNLPDGRQAGLPGSYAPAWEPIWYAFPRWSMGTRNLWERLLAAAVVAGKPLPPDNILIKLIKKMEIPILSR